MAAKCIHIHTPHTSDHYYILESVVLLRWEEGETTENCGKPIADKEEGEEGEWGKTKG